MRPLLFTIGQRFGRWTVVSGSQKRENGRFYMCRCTCGKIKPVAAYALNCGDSISCGCHRREKMSGPRTHGHTVGGKPTREYALYASAKSRANREKLPFDIAVNDIQIPERCPILPWIKLSSGSTLVGGKGKVGDSSPSLDRIIPELGYVKDNIRVISFRANTIKSNRSMEELERELRAFYLPDEMMGATYAIGI
jgi:hypothetical protein